MDPNLEERTLIAAFRNLDDLGKQALLREATRQHKKEHPSPEGSTPPAAQCIIEKGEERPETVAEPIFTA